MKTHNCLSKCFWFFLTGFFLWDFRSHCTAGLFDFETKYMQTVIETRKLEAVHKLYYLDNLKAQTFHIFTVQYSRVNYNNRQPVSGKIPLANLLTRTTQTGIQLMQSSVENLNFVLEDTELKPQQRFFLCFLRNNIYKKELLKVVMKKNNRFCVLRKSGWL